MPAKRAALIPLGILLLVLLAAIGLWYAQDRGLPLALAIAVLPAFLVEVSLYVLAGVPDVRAYLQRWRPSRVALLLTALGPVSWILLSLALGIVNPLRLLQLLALAAAASFWYLVLPRRLPADLGFLVLMATPVLLRVFSTIYPDPADRIPGQVLGALMWYRTGLVAVLCIRRMEGIGFGFLPRPSEWVIGLRNYLWFTPPALGLALAIGFVRFRPVVFDGRLVLLTVLTFAGVLWVLAVAEEFFFRGLLQQQLTRLFGSEMAGLLVASVIFGAAHLPSGDFPNWRFALLATLAGIFYGRAYLQARSIRAAMVTHAMVVTTMKMFLTLVHW